MNYPIEVLNNVLGIYSFAKFQFDKLFAKLELLRIYYSREDENENDCDI